MLLVKLEARCSKSCLPISDIKGKEDKYKFIHAVTNSSLTMARLKNGLCPRISKNSLASLLYLSGGGSIFKDASLYSLFQMNSYFAKFFRESCPVPLGSSTFIH
jgi:hypothetical protein